MMIKDIINHGREVVDPALLYLRMYACVYVSVMNLSVRTSLSSRNVCT